MLQWINTFPLFPSPKKPWQPHSASKVDTCSCVRVHVCVFLCVSKPPRPNKRLPASVKAFHAPGFQLLSRLRDYFLLSIFIWFFFFPSSLLHFLLCLFFPHKQQGVVALPHLSAHPSSFISSLGFWMKTVLQPTSDSIFFPRCRLSPKSSRHNKGVILGVFSVLCNMF